MINKTLFICMLPLEKQEMVRKEIEKFQINIGSENLQEDIQNAMDGRLCDLEEDIDLKELILKMEGYNMGGIKDQRHLENPNACVECESIVQLNKYRVCKECWEVSPAGEVEDWEETL